MSDAPGASPDKPSILIVEDHLETRLLYRCLLQPDYRLSLTHNPAEARATVAGASTSGDEPGPFDLVIMDINLDTGSQGIDLLHALQQGGLAKETPAVAITAHALPGDADRLLAEGFDAYLGKPFTRSELLDTLASVRPAARA
jgi:CheY-like chemotaxis protein